MNTECSGGFKRYAYLITKSFLGLSTAVLIFALPGCATYSAGFAKVESATANRDLDGALKSLDSLKLTGADEILHHLNKGTLLRLQGNYAESNKHLDAAKVLMEKLNAISLTEQAASVAVNDTMKAYEGLPNEQLMVYSFEALNYLQMGDLDAAAVEARQFDVKQQLVARANANAQYLSGAFVRYLNGMIYEAEGERDSARIEMQKAVDGYKAQNSGFTVPAALTADLARIAAGKAPDSEVVFLLHNGLGPSLDEVVIRVANPDPQNGSALLSLAVPKLVKRSLPVSRVELSSGSSSSTSEVVEDVNHIAEKSLNDRLPAITARAVARMVVKNVAAKKTKEHSSNAGSLGLLLNVAADIGTAVSERADTRTWSLLPGNILMARLALPAGQHDVTATYYGMNGNILGTREFRNVEVKAKRKVFVSDYMLTQPAQPRAPQ